MAFDIVWEPRGAHKIFHGHVTDEDLVAALTALHGDSRFDDLRYAINDFLAVESFSVTEDTVRYLAAVDGAAARSNPNIKVAIVVTDERAHALAAHYVKSPRTVFQSQIFHSVEAARSWI